ncbi:biotin--[acetyl-CoA-carboxylase] ligase [Roseibium litorale]|uniref:biotin--[biotin carboxyl-carrier protein] ligase n=1 Tax=Roseibium litorale TaxID=2803841 RepID=A0ABR9CJR8_9HYPH|nr:biotin--[acetyl-CoA-carboxylase] ligase [Roseibium litorale]MBD8891076.1 biotin--[acetyl-CoA-carboxylase] ligase [Roseibium litorale]
MRHANPAPPAPGFRIEWHESVGSTNTLAFEHARDGDPGNLWVVAGEQTLGRGRRGRDWFSLKGNLFASLLLIDPADRDRLGELPLVAAVSLAEAVDAAAGTHQLAGLKWPNDLLVEGAKLSGILLEAETLQDGRLAVVLGFGVNCAAHPELSLYRSTDLMSLGFRVEANELHGHLARILAARLGAWRRPGGFDAVRKAWLSRAVHLGKTITVRNGDREQTGTFVDLDSRGHLILGLDNGSRQTIFAGDVFPQGSQPEGSPSIP